MSVVAELSIFPIGKGEHLHEYVARAVQIIRDSGLTYRLGPMGTSIEGDYEQVMGLVRQCFEALQDDCDRVYLNLKMDWRRGQKQRMDAKVSQVEKSLDG